MGERSPLRAIADYTVSNVDKMQSDDEITVRLCNYTAVYNNEFITLALDFMLATATEAENEKFGLQGGRRVYHKDSESWDDIGVPAIVKETAGDLVCGYHLARHPTAHADTLMNRLSRSMPPGEAVTRIQVGTRRNGVTRLGIPKVQISAR